MKKVIFLMFAVVICSNVQSQVQDGGGHGLMQLVTKANEDMKKVKGSPYLNDDFTSGQVIITGKDPFNAFLRYEVAKDIMEIKTEKGSEETFVLPLSQKAEYKIGDQVFVSANLNNGGINLSGYFIEHYKGENVKFLQKYTATFSEAVVAKTGYEKDRPAEIKIQDQFYMVSKDGKVKSFELKEKEIKKAFSGSKNVEQYLSAHKLKSLEDYLVFFDWYDKQL